MPRHVLLAVLLAVLAARAYGQAVTTVFTYQAQLANAGTPATGVFDMRFRLFDSAAGGGQIGPTLCADNLAVTAGVCTVALDFGPAAFAGNKRYMEVDVRADAGLDCSSTSGFTTLAPRQELTAAPYAQHALTAGSASNTALLNGQAASFYADAGNLTAGTIAETRLPNNVPRLNAASTTFTGPVSAASLSGSGSGITSLNASSLASGTVGDARLSANVALLSSAQTFSAAKTFTAAPAFSAAGAPFTVSSTSLVTNLNADLLDGLSSAAFAPTSHGHDAADVATGVLNIARLPSTVARRDAANTYTALNTFTDAVVSASLGVGTPTPEAPLHVLEGSAGTVSANANASAVFERSSVNYIQLLSPDASERGVIFGSPANTIQAGIYYTNGGSMNFRTGGNATTLRITDSGNVGVGVTTPAAKLHVGGDVQIDGTVTIPATTRVLSIPCTAFGVVSSFTDFSNTSIGLSTWDAGILGQFVAPVLLPDGATIISVTAFINDNSTDDATVYFTRIDLTTGSANVKATCTSSGAVLGMRSFVDSTVSNPIVDNTLYAYTLLADLRGQPAGSSLSLRAVQVRYQVTSPLP